MEQEIPFVFQIIRDHQHVIMGLIILIASPALYKVIMLIWKDFKDDFYKENEWP
jgi:hypothetical protein